MNIDLPVRYSKIPYNQRWKIRNAYVKEQGGKCYHCGCPLDEDPPSQITDMKINWKFFPPGFLKSPMHLHHDHNTDMTIGVVHAYCNAVLWQYYGE